MDELAALLERYPAHAEQEERWDASTIRIGEHLGAALPPDHLISSVRAVVLHAGQVVVVHEPGRDHILPGGRREPGETLEATLRREVLEETGWELGEPVLIGFRHLRHLTPRPAQYRYPYPSFLHVVYAAAGLRWRPEARSADDYVLGASLVPLEAALALPLSAGQHQFLAAALEALAARP